MKKWYEVVRDARLMLLSKERFGYLYGANGENLSTRREAEDLINALWEIYPTHFEDTVIKRGRTKNDLISHLTGKKVYDCSAFICAVTQCRGDITDFYTLNDYNSTSLCRMMVDRSSVRDGFWGNVVWRPGHVALDIGNGILCDFANEFIDMRAYRYDSIYAPQYDFSGRLPWVDYIGAINY